MFNVHGQVYVTNLKEVTPKLIVGDVYCHQKLNEKEFMTTFVKARFIGDSLIHIVTQGVKNKDKIFIDNSVLKSNRYKNKEGKEISNLELTVFKISSINNKDSFKDNGKNRFER